jgi:Site-specific DNA methylase
MSRPVVLDLCAGTGAWSEPYANAGYDVRRIDLPTDVRLLHFPWGIHGILAAPPCTMFCRMRMCRGEPTQDQFREALSVVDACLRLVAVCRPSWWALENPQGYLSRWLGPPQLRFDPFEYGDPWTKRTWVWGNFRLPLATMAAVAPVDSWVRKHGPDGQTGIAKGTAEASRTPPGFAQAFFEANP